MKTKFLLPLFAAVIALAAIAASTQASNKGMVVHEWGTFTSLQGGDGKLIAWQPLQTSRLPNFVHTLEVLGFGKNAGVATLQRLETPVIYFYANKESAKKPVDVSVQFPQGRLTEWYPQATRMGPIPGQRTNSTNNEGFIDWSGLTLMPPDSKLNPPSDASGSHYFAARDTDANYVRWSKQSENHPAESETDKFLFYRGVGNFTTPLRVTMKADDSVVIANTGKEPLSHLFVLGINNKSGSFAYVPALNPGEEKTVPISSQTLAGPKLTQNISHDMAQALVKSGLYPREATAMVNTWKDSWFAEDGLRVLYILPRHWTDATLPMTINPTPRELVRVMVGRAEILRPSLEHSLALDLDKAKQGDSAAENEVRKTLHSLGRFAQPAFGRALTSAKPKPAEQTRLWALLKDANKPE